MLGRRVMVYRRLPCLFNHTMLDRAIIQLQITLTSLTRKPSHSLITHVRSSSASLACARLAERVERTAECVAEEVQGWSDDGWHASADDANFGFDGAPEGDLCVFVCSVCDFADLGEVFEADHAADCDEEAD